MSIRFRQLQAFHSIIDTGTVTRAADQLGISQPAVSNLLAQLEHETRVRLFQREKGRLIPTPEAFALYSEVDTVVRGLDHVEQAVQDLRNKQAGQLQIASQQSLSFGFIPRLIAKFARNRPDVSISFQSQYAAKIQEWVLAGLFEIGISELPTFQEGLSAHRFRVEFKIALPENHRLADQEVLTPADLDSEPFVVMGPDHVSYRRTRDAFQEAGVDWRPRIHTHLFKNTLSFVKEGMGVAIIDPFVLDFDFEGGFVSRTFRPKMLMEMAIITSRSRPISSLGQEFLTLLKDQIRPYTVDGFDSD